MDPLADKFSSNNPYAYGNNNPTSTIDISGKYAVSVHYDITYGELIKLGYSQHDADRIAHYASTYSDHPTTNVLMIDALGHATPDPHTAYRSGMGYDYSKTAESQSEKNSRWHAMMSNKEAEDGMTEEQATLRGLQFGWDNIFEYAASPDDRHLGNLDQGIHALQDAVAHGGIRTNDHLGLNLSSFKKDLNDMWGGRDVARNLTRSALIVVDVLQGKKTI